MPTTARQAIAEATERALRRLNVCCVGRIERYDPDLQEADVQPLVRDAYRDETDTLVQEQLPLVTSCPVYFPGDEEFWLNHSVEVGSKCLLIFSQAPLDSWLASGDVVDGVEGRRNHLSDGIALVGIRDFQHPRTKLEGKGIGIFHKSGLGVKVTETQAEVAGADHTIGFGDAIKSYIDSEIRAKFAAHTHTFSASVTGGAGGSVAGTTAVPSNTMGDSGQLGSSKAKVGT